MGCTDCGRKGGCDSRKHEMFGAVDAALAALYPTRRWGERDEARALGAGIGADEGRALAAAMAERLKTFACWRAGGPDEWCDYIYVLCLGRTPAIVEIRDGLAAAPAEEAAPAEAPDAPESEEIDERYLRVTLSSLARFAGVQEVAMTLRRAPDMAGAGDDDADDVAGAGDGGALIVTESARGGVFDPILLRRFQGLVAVLAEAEIRHIDFGEIVEPPPDFDAGDYVAQFGAEPVIANYLFYPQPPTAVSTVVLDEPRGTSAPPGGAPA